MIRTISITCMIALGCSKPTSEPAHPSTAHAPTAYAAKRDLAAASKRFRTALSAHNVEPLLAADVQLENGNAQMGCKEPAEPCVKETVPAAEAAKRLTQQIEGYAFSGPEQTAADLGCDASCCSYGPFQHGDLRIAISQICFDDSPTDPKIIMIVGN